MLFQLTSNKPITRIILSFHFHPKKWPRVETRAFIKLFMSIGKNKPWQLTSERHFFSIKPSGFAPLWIRFHL